MYITHFKMVTAEALMKTLDVIRAAAGMAGSIDQPHDASRLCSPPSRIRWGLAMAGAVRSRAAS